MTTSIDRREFLRLSALAATSTMASRGEDHSISALRQHRIGDAKKVIIVGAGLAGLTAAYELTNMGHEVVVLEAQTLPGGRVRTLRAPFADGLYAELGAGRIPDNHHWTLKYVREFGLSLSPFYPNELDFTTFVRNKSLQAHPAKLPDLSKLPLSLTTAENELGMHGLMEKVFGAYLERLTKRTEWPPPDLRTLDGMTVREFIKSRGLSDDVFDALGLAPFQDQSVLEAISVIGNGHGAQNMHKIEGGNDLLPKAFADRLTEKIRYGSPVVRLHQDDRSVQVEYHQNGRQQRISGDKLICAIPFTVLRNLDVSPGFSRAKERVIREMGYISLSRVTFQVRERYWQKTGASGFANTDFPGEIWDASFGQPAKRGLIQLYLQGASSEHATSMSDRQRIQFGIELVDRVFPGLETYLEGAETHCWDNEPWSRGAVRLMKAGQVFDFQEHITSPERHIHFAGEHTSSWFAWMNGAIESGFRAAKEVNEAT